MSLNLVALHQPGDTVLHRAPVGAKLAGLAAYGVATVVVPGLRASFGFLALAVVLALVARLSLGTIARGTRAVLVFAVLASVFQAVVSSPERALATLLDLLALALAAVVVTATTPVNAMLDALVRGLSPLRRLGVRPDTVALTLALAVQSIPGTVALALETRDAARARGLGRHPRAFLTPFVIRVVARAQETGDALTARGVLEADSDQRPPARTILDP